MKNTRISLCIAALALAGLLPMSIPRAHAFGDMDREATVELLTSGPWRVGGSSWSVIRTFNKDETFTTQGGKGAHGHWSIDNDKVVLIFSDKHRETIKLPLDPKGTPGYSDDGVQYTCTMVNPPAAAGTPPPLVPPIGAASNTSRFAGTVWVHTNDKGQTSTLTFGADGAWSEDFAPHPLHGTWKITADSNVAEVSIVNGNISGNKVIHFTMSSDGASCTRQESSVTWLKPGAQPQQSPQTAGDGGTGAFGSASQSAAAAQTPPPTPITPELQQKAGDLVKTYHNSLVFVTGKAGSGSGFITTIGKTNFLVTNAHVAAGITDAAFKTLDDTPVQGGAASIAVGRDIFCMALPAGGTPLEIMQDVEGNAAIGDDVVVLGNAEGQGVINTITGKIVGIGPNLVEVDAPFVPGNSGSPIIHLKTGKVVGVATYTVTKTYDETTNQKIATPIVRRFGYRLDNVKSWQGVEWRSFYAQAAEMDKIETLTADLGDFFDDIVENKGTVTAGRHTNPVIKNRIDEWLESKTGNMSATDESMANANFLSFLKVACQADVTAARQHMTYDYFQRELADQQRTRDEMSKSFTEIIKEIRN